MDRTNSALGRRHAALAALFSLAAAIAVVAAQAPGVEGLGVSGQFANLDGRRLWYVDAGGAGVAVVFLHAGSGSSVFWEQQFPAFRTAGYRPIAYDRVGSGRSALAAGADPGTAADDLLALIDHLRLARVHLVGTAAGGIVAFDFALSFPDRLRGLVVANSIGGVQNEEYLAVGRRLRPSPQFEALPVEFRELGPSYRAVNAAGVARWLALEHQAPAAIRLPAPQQPRQDVTFERLESIKTPTLLLTGDADLYSPPAVLRLFAARIRHAETLIVPETGHSAYWEQPEVFNRSVLAFIAKH